MAIFRLQVNYTFGVLGKWSNVWHMVAADMAAAVAAPVLAMEDHLLAFLSSECTIKSYVVSEVEGDAFFTEDRFSAGANASLGSLLPLYNTVKVIFPSSDFGRPDLKYFKGSVGEAVQTSGFLESAFSGLVDTEVEGMIDDMFTNATPLCSESGDEYETASVQPAVQMRQMHRKRKKTVVIP